MGRTPVTIGTPDGGPRVVDRSAGRSIPLCTEASGDSPFCSPGTESVLSGAPAMPRLEASISEAEVDLQQIWFQLSVPDRQRFGHCFSAMVLKALGLPSCPKQEENA